MQGSPISWDYPFKKKDLAYATPATTIWHLCKTNKTVTYHVNAKVNFKLHFDSDGTSIFHILACYRRPNRIVVQSLVTDMRFSSFFLHHILQSIWQYHGWLKSAELYYKNRNWSTVLPYGKGSVYHVCSVQVQQLSAQPPREWDVVLRDYGKHANTKYFHIYCIVYKQLECYEKISCS